MNEVWFDTRSGTLVPKTADPHGAETVQPAADGAIIPLKELLQTPDFPFKPGDFERPKAEWDREKCIELGKWVLGILQEDDKVPVLRTEYFRRLHILGLAPHIKALSHSRHNDFASFADYKRAVGAPVNRVYGAYDEWDEYDLADHADKLSKGKKISQKTVQEAAARGQGPGYKIFIEKAGGIRRLNELRGFYEARYMNKDDCRRWGAKVMIANEGNADLVPVVVRILSAAGRGPSEFTCKKYFDNKWSVFKKESAAERDIMLQKEAQAKIQLIKSCVPDISNEQCEELGRQTVERIVSNLRKLNPALTTVNIELEAITADISDILWPPDNYRKHLRIPPKQLEQAYKAQAERLRQWKRGKKAS